MTDGFERREMLAVMAAGVLVGCARTTVASGGLRVADQMQALQTVLAASGERPAAGVVEWSNFLGGPSIIAAATGGSIDLGWMAETPLVFAQAAGSPVKVVAVARAAHDDGDRGTGMAIVVAPGSPIREVGQLKGKRVVYSPGTITHYFALRALEAHGLTLADIEPVTVTPGAAEPLLAAGKVDALITVEPLLSAMTVPGKARVLLSGGAPLTPELYYLVAPDATLADPKRAAAIDGFVERVGRAFRWWREHPGEAAAAAARQYRLPEPVARSVARYTMRRLSPVTPEIVAAQQVEADTFRRIGLIRRPVDAAALYDRRFEPAIARAERGAA